MKTNRLFQKLIACFVLAMLTFSVASLQLPAYAYAYSGDIVAFGNPGDKCQLPDGTNEGVIQSDQHTCCPKGPQDPVTCLYEKYINPAISLLSALVGIVVVVGIVTGAVQYVTSASDPQKVTAAKKRITSALIGLVAFLLLYAFLQFLIPGGLLNG